jgi:hypothetical protein
MSSTTLEPGELHEEAEATPRPRSRLRAFSKTTWALIVAMVALIGSGSSALFTFLPQLKPDPRDSVLAQLNVYAMEPGVSLQRYLALAYGSVTPEAKALGIPNAELAFQGDMVYVRTRVDGFKHRRVRLMATLYMKSTQEPARLTGGLASGPAALRLRTVTLDTPSTSTVQLLWMLGLDDEPPTFVRVEMFDGTRMLAVTDSPIVRNGRAPLPGV